MASKLITKTVRNPLRAGVMAAATVLALTAGSATALAGPVTSYTVNNAGDSFTVTWTAFSTGWSKNSNNYNVTGGATADFKVKSISGTSAIFDVTVKNTTTLPAGVSNVNFTSFGWNTSPETTDASLSPTSVYNDALLNAKLSGVDLNICLVGGTNCNGGGSGGLGGLAAGSKTEFQLNLDFSSSVPPLTFSGFYGKFQGSLGSQEVDGYITKVPEPGSLALLGTGLIGLGFALRRRRRT